MMKGSWFFAIVSLLLFFTGCGESEESALRSNLEVESGAVASGRFSIELVYPAGTPAAWRDVFERAASRWSQVIVNDLPDQSFDSAALPTSCGLDPEAGTLAVDDLLIVVEIRPIDGEAGVLGQAGPCVLRQSDFSPLVGFMEFDDADLRALQAAGRLEDVVLHEMAHVLGIGTLWEDFLLRPSLVEGPGSDTRFAGAFAAAAYRDLGGIDSTVPVENDGRPGSADGHWRESIFRNELMSPRLSGSDTSLPLSRVTAASLADLGFYEVTFSAVDGFSVATSVRSNSSSSGLQRAEMEHDLIVPEFAIDERGQLTRLSPEN